VDRPPFSFWYHFGLQHLPGTRHAETEIDFYRAYDLDFLKVMSDYPYPLPQGLDAVLTAEDWARVEPTDGSADCWAEQLTALSLINDAIGGEAMFIETVFSPWTTARRMTRSGGLREAMQKSPEQLLAAMDAVATSLAAYAAQAVARGAAGIFFSVGAASADVMTAEEYQRWGRPFDQKVLDAVSDAAFNVLHVHGNKIHFEEARQLPAAAINWSHFATEPGLAEGKARWGKAVLGGIDEATASHVAAFELRKQIEGAFAATRPSSLLITPGCSIPTDTPVRNLRAIKEAVTSIGKLSFGD
jgi:uroporphyrinogen decarboxylase